MTMQGKTVIEVGPWPGGVNRRDEDKSSRTVNPKQLRWSKNLDILDSGVVQSRLGCRKVLSTAPIYGGTSISLISSIVEGSGHLYAVVGKVTAGPVTAFYYTKDPENPATGWNAIATTQTGTFTDAIKYNNVIYFVQAAGGAGTGQSRTALTGGGWTAQANIPKGDQAFVVKDRMFVVDWNLSKVYWSKATDPTIWAAPDGGNVLVSPGDGEPITKVVFINNSIYIFKRNKTFLFTFNTDPAIDGQLTPLSTVRGAHDALVYNNEIYIVNDQSIFKLVNNFFSDIGVLADFYKVVGPDQLFDPLCRLFLEGGDKLIVGPVNIVYSGQLFSHYAMNLKTGAWSFRFYNDSAIQPQSNLQKKCLVWRDSGAVAGNSLGNIYISVAGSGLLSYTRFKSWNTADILNNTLDINSNEHTISPEYSIVTHEIIPEDSYYEWKRCYFIMGTWYMNMDPLTDSAPLIDVRLGPDLYTLAQTVNLPLSSNFFAVEQEGKAPFKSFRFKSLAISIYKASQDLGTIAAKDPNSNSVMVIKNIQIVIGSNRQAVSEAVNAV